MAQVFSAPLEDIAAAARSGAAQQAQRENNQLAIDYATRQQVAQLHYDQLSQAAYDRDAERRYDLANRREARQADQALAAQKFEQGQLQDERDHEQTAELQLGRQRHGWGLKQADLINEDVKTVHKALLAPDLNPTGKMIAGKLLNRLGILRKNLNTKFITPDEYAGFVSKWLGEVADANIDAYRVQEPTPDQHLAQNSIDPRTGKPPVFDGADPPQTLLVRRRDKSGNFYWKTETLGGSKASSTKSQEPKTPAERYSNSKLYDAEEAAARKRLAEASKNGDEPINPAAIPQEDVHREMLRHRAAQEQFTKGLANGFAPPATSITPLEAQPSTQQGFTPNTNPLAPATQPPLPGGEQTALPQDVDPSGQLPVTQPAAPQARTSAIETAQAPITSTLYDTKESRQDGSVMKWLDEQGLTPYTFGATPHDLAVMPQDAFKQFLGMAQARKAAAESQQSPVPEKKPDAEEPEQVALPRVHVFTDRVLVPSDHPAADEAVDRGMELQPGFTSEAAFKSGRADGVTMPLRDWLALGGDESGGFRGIAQGDADLAKTDAANQSAPSGTESTQQGPAAKPKTPSVESAIVEGTEVKLKYGDGELATKEHLRMADGRKLAVASVEIGGKKLRAMHTGGAWRILHVDPTGQIKPLGTLNGPGAGSKENPIVFNSSDADEISAALPKGAYLRDETGDIFENK